MYPCAEIPGADLIKGRVLSMQAGMRSTLFMVLPMQALAPEMGAIYGTPDLLTSGSAHQCPL